MSLPGDFIRNFRSMMRQSVAISRSTSFVRSQWPRILAGLLLILVLLHRLVVIGLVALPILISLLLIALHVPLECTVERGRGPEPIVRLNPRNHRHGHQRGRELAVLAWIH